MDLFLLCFVVSLLYFLFETDDLLPFYFLATLVFELSIIYVLVYSSINVPFSVSIAIYVVHFY